MDGVVVFDKDKFRQLYPKLDFNDAQLDMFFLEATMLLNNTPCSCVKSLVERELLLFLLVAHLATLQARLDSGNEAVGRVGSASEGSVSVSMDYGQTTPGEKWYVQTPYGAKYWQLTARYRSALYVVTNYPMPVRR
ncbi:DUF4054 domain-containing protein [Acinetobacter larvae]|uniref:DUF4054 domain-containing protein n=1 Tax=Acinetobacter larvae TaxID=1789224 RepID=A0A1B2LZF9_9GAMM|nr:DUF4054 domain-containing protein [Acinetobacter larvae]AOA58325.1 hypothetical protein BFG52_08125 [Acinetobacter larvae]